jgi:hypothetical protein
MEQINKKALTTTRAFFYYFPLTHFPSLKPDTQMLVFDMCVVHLMTKNGTPKWTALYISFLHRESRPYHLSLTKSG